MLYVFHGNPKIVAEKAESLLATLAQKHHDASLVRCNDADAPFLADLLSSRGLFRQSYILYINTLSSEVVRDAVFSLLPECAASPHVVVLSCQPLDGDTLRAVTLHAHKIQSCRSGEGDARAITHDPFALTEAFFTRDTKNMFIELERSRLSNEKAEEVIGRLLWAVKSMVQVGGATHAEFIEMKEYTFRKAQGARVRWGAEKVCALLAWLVLLPSECYQSGKDVYDVLEERLCG